MPQTITFPTASPVTLIPGDPVTISTASGSYLVRIQCNKPSSISFKNTDASVLASGDVANGELLITLTKANSTLVVDSYSSAVILLTAVSLPDSGVKELPVLGPNGTLGALSPGSLYQVNIRSASPYTCVVYSMPESAGTKPLGVFPVVNGDVISLPGPKVTYKMVTADTTASACLQLVITNPKAVS